MDMQKAERLNQSDYLGSTIAIVHGVGAAAVGGLVEFTGSSASSFTGELTVAGLALAAAGTLWAAGVAVSHHLRRTTN